MSTVATPKTTAATTPVIVMPDHFCDVFSQFVSNDQKLSFLAKELHSHGEALVEFEKRLYHNAKSLCFANKVRTWDICELAGSLHGFFMQPIQRDNHVITDDNNYIGYTVDYRTFGLIVSLKSFQYFIKYFKIKDHQQSRIFEFYYDTLQSQIKALASYMLIDTDNIITEEEKAQVREMCHVIDRFTTL